MRVAPPKVPRAAQVAFSSSQGPRVLPGTYTVRLTKGKEVYETKLAIGLDPRAKFNLEDRKAQFDAAMQVRAMFGQMSDLVDKINYARNMAAQSVSKLPENDALRKDLQSFSNQADEIRKKIVATKEGGAITGEQRLREDTDDLYGAILSYEGRPAQYQLERIGILQHELDDVVKEFDALSTKELPKLNEGLKSKGMQAIEQPPASPGE